MQPYGTAEQINCKVAALAATMDLPAAAAVKEIHQWNGRNGCTMCEEEGARVVTGIHGGTCRAYQYPQETFIKRTDERIHAQAGENLESEKVVCNYN